MGSGERNGVREVGDDIPPPNTKFTCAQQAAWGKCGRSWMKNACCRSCGGCSKKNPGNGNAGGMGSGERNGVREVGDDTPPPNTKFTCAQQAAWGKCDKSWMKGKCCRSCGGCSKRGSGNAGGMGSGERNGVREVGDDSHHEIQNSPVRNKQRG